MKRVDLINQIRIKKSCLCVGLDTDLTKIPTFLLDHSDPVFEFNKAIIDATREHCVAYKPNIAFYEALGSSGWVSLQKTINHIGSSHFIIADAKRGDIGNTAEMYAKTFFETYNADAVTIAPYMGEDSVKPFLDPKFGSNGKWGVVLALTSNQGAKDFQWHGDPALYEVVLRKTMEWGSPENLMFVVGATRGEDIKKVRMISPEHFFLVPGVGAQGGSLEDVMKFGMNADIGLLVNSTRDIIYRSKDEFFAEQAAEQASKVAKEMKVFM
jgi:orotidine-5'-phosphate decarboxylase